ncbi:MAG TPA: GAF domain-containing sensor histidine kinase [Leptolyngbyaceae cyanobacterium M65_K2018_010]|nr:GAF domain-containing sensor histidine kinase [Leptolyngbyaceae cyanobacterium M65_K2018_010]
MDFSIASEYGLPYSDAAVQSWPCCRLLDTGQEVQVQQRLAAIAALNFGSNHSIPALEEAIQLACRFVHAPVGWVSIADATTEHLKATHGLSFLGLGNRLAETRQLPLATSLSAWVLAGEQPLVVSDTAALPAPAQGELIATYGIAAFCAVPLMTWQGQCIGVLAVMDTSPRSFSQRDVGFLAMAARWGLGGYERTRPTPAPAGRDWATGWQPLPSPDDTLRLHLISHLVQDLRNPLTAVLGMTSMLSQQIYGPLTAKQREYTDIVRRSSQTLMAQVDEIIDLGLVGSGAGELVPASVDISRLGQQVVTILSPLADKLGQTLELTVEPDDSLWILDQRTVKQILYHTVFSLMQMATEHSTLRLHASRKKDLALVFWVAHPGLGEGLPEAALELFGATPSGQREGAGRGANPMTGSASAGSTAAERGQPWQGLLLSQRLAQHHGGQLQIHGNGDIGHRLVISLPALKRTPPLPAAEAQRG